jgi:putative ABC transport system permease protein
MAATEPDRSHSLTVESVRQDVRYALRTLRRSPGFTAAALVTLALGIGANTAMFSVVHAVLLRPLPYPEPERIVQLVRRHPGSLGEGHTGRRYLFFRDHLQVEALAAWRGATGINLVAGQAAEFVQAMPVSKEFFDVFGVRPAIGTTFTADHDRLEGPAAAILGHGLWMRRFGGDPGIVGSTIVLGDRAHVVLGVMPASFAVLQPPDLYVPLQPSLTGPGGGFNYTVAARLRRGTSVAQANANAESVWHAMKAEFPGTVLRDELPSGVEPLQKTLARGVQPGLLTLFGAVLLLLLIACANTANLMLARASVRGREMALRAALGAGRRRIVRQLLTESVLLSLAGGALGGLLAYWLVPVLLGLTPPNLRLYQDVRLDPTVLLVTLAVAAGTGMLFGLAPALALSRTDLVEAFKDDGTRSVGSGRGAWLRPVLVVAEIAVCTVLLVGAGLLVKTFTRLSAVDPGFDPAGIVTARMSLQGARYAAPDAYLPFFEQGLDRLRRIPGVRAAAVVNGVPIERGLNLNVDILDLVEPDGRLRYENALTDWRYASTDYFATMGIPIVAGRGFEAGDRAGAPPVAVVNEEFARRFFAGTPAIGRRLRVFDSDGAIEIVGVARDVREQGLTRPLPPLMYVPVTQANPAGVRAAHTYFQMSWVVRVDAPGPALERDMREALRTLDPAQPFSSFRTMEEVKSAAVDTQRFHMVLLTAFAGVGLLLAAAGVYGVVAYAAAQRTREFGIRMALGAPRARILESVIGHGARLAAAGVGLGMAASIASRRVLDAFVWGVSTLDPSTFVTVAIALPAIAMVASLVPALRAVRLDPTRALRD